MFKPSERTKGLKQSGIRAASSRCASVGGINLGQGICDLPTPDSIKASAYAAVANDNNIYSACEGIGALREAIADKCAKFNRIDCCAESEVMVSHGSSGAFVCAAQTLFNPGDEVIVFEPFYGYHKNILALFAVTVKAISIGLDDFSIDFQQLRDAIGPNTKAIIVCTPNNPTGKVYTREELTTIGDIALEKGCYVITDEIYEYITYPGHEHLSMASLEAYRNITITISGFSKTYNMTGWRLGYALGPAEIIEKMALVQDLLYVCPSTPLQHAAIAAFQLPDTYFSEMRALYLDKRDKVLSALNAMGVKATIPQGAYYILAEFDRFDFNSSEHIAEVLMQQAQVAVVPGDSFYLHADKDRRMVRLCYAMNEERVMQAMNQMASVLKAPATT